MALLPEKMRYWLFDIMSRQTMRYVHATPPGESNELGKEVYRQVVEDFFINGSLTSRSKVPELFAGIWSAGRETILVEDHLDKVTKEAMVALLSGINDCPYCGDMLVSLVHAGEKHDEADNILGNNEDGIEDVVLQQRLAWVRAVVTGVGATRMATPFTERELPEALGSMLAMSDINRFSHVVMAGSPVKAPFGLEAVKSFLLRVFGGELVAVQNHVLVPGRAAGLLPERPLQADMRWAEGNPRIAGTLAAYAAVVEKEGAKVLSGDLRSYIEDRLTGWEPGRLPLGRSWVEKEVAAFDNERDRQFARFALLLAKAPYQLDEKLNETVLELCGDEETFIRFLAWCSFTSARYLVASVARRCGLAPRLAA